MWRRVDFHFLLKRNRCFDPKHCFLNSHIFSHFHLRLRLKRSRSCGPKDFRCAAGFHIPDMHPQEELDMTVLRKRRVGFRQGILSLHGRSDGVYSVPELRQHAVARRRCGLRTSQSCIQDFPGNEGGDLVEPPRGSCSPQRQPQR
jgi:hypothetical protein